MTQKSESVREAEQRNPKTLRRELVDAIVEAYEDHNDDSEQFREVTGILVSIHEQFIAKSATLRLAEQAEQKSECFTKENPLMWLKFAAWLREKAR